VTRTIGLRFLASVSKFPSRRPTLSQLLSASSSGYLLRVVRQPKPASLVRLSRSSLTIATRFASQHPHRLHYQLGEARRLNLPCAPGSYPVHAARLLVLRWCSGR
jgi:hypothetical protein